MAGGNRKERRAAASQNEARQANSSATNIQPSTELDEKTIELLLEHPDRSGPKGKTLFQLAEERQRELNKGKPTKWNLDEGNTPDGEQPFDDEPLGPAADSILYAVSMATLHVTLDVMVYSQYREEVHWAEIFQRAAVALPIFWLLVYLTHLELANRFPIVRNSVFMVGAVSAGCYMVYSGNRNGYFYVMKSAPPIGTLWIWSVIEMHFGYAGASAAAVFAYLWWNQFDFF